MDWFVNNINIHIFTNYFVLALVTYTLTAALLQLVFSLVTTIVYSHFVLKSGCLY